MTGRGVPDSNYCCEGVEGWIEFKVTAGWTVAMRPEQVGWLMRRSRAGGRCWVAVRRRCPSGPRREPADELWLFPGVDALVLQSDGLAAFSRALTPAQRWEGGPAKWDWGRIADLLTT